VSFAVAARRGDDLRAQLLFTHFMQAYDKQYVSPDVEQYRFQVFKQNLIAIDRLNALEAQEQAVFGVNEFSDLTPSEFRRQYLGFRPDPANAERRANAPVVPPLPRVSIPTNFNWSNAVTPVKNQKQCGSCWAFSATEEIESIVYLKHQPQAIYALSPQQIVDCDKKDSGCGGGDTVTAYEYVIKAPGMEQNSDYPYTAKNGKCQFDASKVVAKISNWSYVTTPKQKNETQMLYYIATTAPVSICVDASSWQYYTGGIITKGCGDTLDHCVQITGFGTDAKSGVDYWLIRNSWGTVWGESGYLQVERNKNLCGVADEVTVVQAV